MADIPIGSSEYEAEKAKWEQPNRVFHEFPKMLYKAAPGASGQPEVANQTVRSVEEEAGAARDGWFIDPKTAIEQLKKLQDAVGTAAAEAAGKAHSMSGKALREYEAAERASEDHVTEDDVPRGKKK